MRLFLVAGQSMAPRLSHQALVLVRPFRNEPQPGDITVYRHPAGGFPVVHRLHRRVAGGWLAGGDANSGLDPGPVPEAAFYGRVWLSLPRLGRLITILRRWMGLWKN